MKIAVVQYNAGNTQSVLFALERLGVKGILTDDIDVIRSADKVILPGVGEAGSAMKALKEKELDVLIPTLSQPVLGVCLGLQLLCRHSEEGDTDCLSVFDACIKKFNSRTVGIKVPHTGWNTIANLKSALFKGIGDGSYMYFVHSYYAGLIPDAISHTEYGLPFSSAIQRDNFFGVQFHPEKSGIAGQKLLENFINL